MYGVLKVLAAAGVVVALAGAPACRGADAGRAAAALAKAEYVPGQLVVTFADGTAAADIDAAVAAAGAELVERSAVTPERFVVAVPAGEEEEYAAAFMEMENVRAAEKNYVMNAFGTGGAVK